MTVERPTAFVSTGELPPPGRVRMLVDAAHERFASIDDGRPSQVHPALAQASPELFGICVVGARGGVYGVGDADVEFTIMSVAKPFVLALICAAFGPEEVRRRVGVNATGLPFNSLTAIEQGDAGRTNPMVNAGGDRDDEPHPRRHARRAMGLYREWPVALCWAATLPRRDGLSLRLGDELREPEHGQPA
jgi:Glutaminase